MQYDSFELLYVYIKKLDRCFENQSFNFSNDYHVEYDIKNKKLKITKNDNNVLKDFFSPKIKSINLVVGKNGSGKTTLFDLLGLKKVDRDELSSSDGWFLLYKCGHDNEFYVEGFNSELLFKPQKLINEQLINPLYAVDFYYDFKTMEFYEKNFIDDFDLSFIFYNKNKTYSSLLPPPFGNNANGNLLERKYIKTGNLADLYYLATNNHAFIEVMKKETWVLTIDIADIFILKHSATDFDVNRNVGDLELIFNSKFNNDEYHQLDVKEKYRFILLKSMVCFIYNRIKYPYKYTSDIIKKYLVEVKEINSSVSTIDKINNMCKITCRYLYEITENRKSFECYEFLDNICNQINSLPDNYISYVESNEKSEIFPYIIENLKIKINLNDKFNVNVFKLLKLYDMSNSELRYLSTKIISLFSIEKEFFTAFKEVFQVHLNHQISEGELGLINTYSGIYYALTNEYKNQKSAIILLDEPDKSFHPMWIASFIDNLIKLVESINNEMTYQFIISTHSPFMLSDVPKEAITCIDIVDHHRIVSQAKTSFASNYYDIIKDTFFLKDSVGTFAKRKINEIIEEINNLNSNTNQETITKLNNLINIIDDPYLKNTLSLQLNKKIAKFNQKTALALEKQQLEARIKEITLLLGDKDD